MILGAHESTAGGLHLAAERARRDGAVALQIFTTSPTQWRPRPIGRKEAVAFGESCRKHGIRAVMAHGSYLINLASPDQTLWMRSVCAFSEEIVRCARLGIGLLVTHPGSAGGRDERWATNRVARALDEAFARAGEPEVTVLLENTAGQGSQIGHRFEHLAAIRRASSFRSRIAACLDTQHAFAAGYDLATDRGYDATLMALDRAVGLGLVRAFHLNDSKRPCGSRVDRHERIGLGLLGDTTFRRLLRDRRFADVPGVLETPPLPSGRPSFASGLRRLRRLIGSHDDG